MQDQATNEVGVQVIRREGEYWTVIFDGATCRLRDSNGLRYLAYLLRHPHERVSAPFLERVGEATGGIDTPLAPVDGIDLARQERARVNVTRAIATVMKRLDQHLPPLKTHLQATLHTGGFCMYTPDPRVPAAWMAGGA